MKGLTDYITSAPWEDILTILFVLIDDAYKELDGEFIPNRKHSPQGGPAFSDSEAITIAAFGEMIFDGAEDKTPHFIRQYHLSCFPAILDNGRFNRRRQSLATTMEAIRCQLRDRWRIDHPLSSEETSLKYLFVPILEAPVAKASPSISAMSGSVSALARKVNSSVLAAMLQQRWT